MLDLKGHDCECVWTVFLISIHIKAGIIFMCPGVNALSDDEIIVLSEINFKPFNASACFFFLRFNQSVTMILQMKSTMT